MKYTIQDTFDVSAPKYWELLFDENFNAELWPYLEVEWELLEFNRTGEGDDLVIERKQKLTPKRQMPKVMQKIAGGQIWYVEHNLFVARDNKMDVKATPSVAADRIDNHGVYRLEVLGDNKVNRIYEGVCDCRVPLVGGKIEEAIVSDVKESYRKATEFTRKWIATKL